MDRYYCTYTVHSMTHNLYILHIHYDMGGGRGGRGLGLSPPMAIPILSHLPWCFPLRDWESFFLPTHGNSHWREE